MSRFGKRGVRCDGCGAFTPDRDGYAVINGKGGHITSQGRGCEHDFCDACEEKHAPAYSCSKCGCELGRNAPSPEVVGDNRTSMD